MGQNNVTPSGKTLDLPVKMFKDKQAFAIWLEKNHDKSTGLWLRIAKKDSGLKSVSYMEAIDVALCYGWIDGKKDKYDESSWVQRFTRRGQKSIWSKINREKATKLIDCGDMKPPGLAAIKKAKDNGQWISAYDSHSTAVVPDDFQAELDKNSDAAEFFTTLNRTNRYAILFRIQTAKRPETRLKRIQDFIERLKRREKIHP